MKKTIGRTIIALFTAIILTLSFMPTRVWALNYDTLWIGNTRITGSGYWTTDDSGNLTASDAGNYNVAFDADTNTLTLNNATIAAQFDQAYNNSKAGIYAYSRSGAVSLTIQVTGNNVVSGSIGIYALSNGGEVSVRISGDGSLTASGSYNGISIVSEFSNAALAIEGTAVKASGSYSEGVWVQAGESSTGSLSVDGGSLTASGNTGIEFLFSTGMSGSGTPSLTVAGNAVVDAKSGGIAHNSSNNLSIQGNSGIVFDGTEGTVYGDVTLDESLTINQGETLTIPEGATLNSNGNLTNNGTILASGGTLEGTLSNGTTPTTPNITEQPYDYTVTEGEDATFTVEASAGSETLTYQWQQSTDNGSSWTNIESETNASYTINSTNTSMNDYQYRCVVTGSGGVSVISQTATLTVQAKPASVPVTGLELNKDSLTLQENSSNTLIATVKPDDATNQDVIWKSSDTSIATVSEDGTVTAISAGSATITATAADGSGKSASCSVTVTHGNMVHTPKKDATCTADGNEEYWTCETCGNHFSDAEGKTEIELSDTVISATGHNLIKTEANKATMDASGNIEYWYCSDCEKYFKDEKGEHEITLDETVIAKLPKLLNGANAEWSKGKKEGLTFSVDANISDFIGVKVDQQELDPSMYEVRSGSTIITLKPSYLESLSSGKHEIRMEFKSGTIQTYFTIKKGSDSQTPETGQQTNLYMWIGLLAASALVLGFIGWKRHSK
ncbi:Ig-like domain-containing protein [Faecalicoccus acidiformans]|uniref:Ig-like domain-containing protein n=1 Tax=Faecalicoccus acidiformans TaxID=915173 RepID=UPI0023575030|nr:Ig-like domain-containing protein [Faecalicoccus acidiformans]